MVVLVLACVHSLVLLDGCPKLGLWSLVLLYGCPSNVLRIKSAFKLCLMWTGLCVSGPRFISVESYFFNSPKVALNNKANSGLSVSWPYGAQDSLAEPD